MSLLDALAVALVASIVLLLHPHELNSFSWPHSVHGAEPSGVRDMGQLRVRLDNHAAGTQADNTLIRLGGIQGLVGVKWNQSVAAS